MYYVNIRWRLSEHVSELFVNSIFENQKLFGKNENILGSEMCSVYSDIDCSITCFSKKSEVANWKIGHVLVYSDSQINTTLSRESHDIICAYRQELASPLTQMSVIQKRQPQVPVFYPHRWYLKLILWPWATDFSFSINIIGN